MQVRIDHQSDALYIDLTGRPVEESEEVSDGIILDYDADGHLVGIEVLDASAKAGDPLALKRLLFDVPESAA